MINSQQLRINEEIKAREVLLIDHNGKKVGVVPVKEALKIAEEAGLDLVEVAPNSKPPVCRVLDFGKYMYELRKKEHEAKKKQKQIQVKVVKFRPKIGEHDYQVKLKHIRKFIEEGNKVKVVVFLRGRERAKPELAHKIINRVIEDTVEIAEPDKNPKAERATVFVSLMPKK